MARQLSNLQVALLVSIGLHGGLLTLKIADPERFQRMFQDTPLEVILVNARSSEAPDKAQALAQANLIGGGDAAVDRRVTSPLAPSPRFEQGESTEEAHARISQLQEDQQRLLAQLRRELALLPAPDPQREQRDPQARAQAEKRRQLVQHLGEIEKRVNEENARPRKRYLSPATREVAYARYYDTLRRRIEERGTRDFPSHQGRKLYGELVMNIHVDLKGRLVETELIQGSGNRQLDQRAIAIVRACQPFGAFDKEMRKSAEVLVITTRFKFSREDGLETTITERL